MSECAWGREEKVIVGGGMRVAEQNKGVVGGKCRVRLTRGWRLARVEVNRGRELEVEGNPIRTSRSGLRPSRRTPRR